MSQYPTSSDRTTDAGGSDDRPALFGDRSVEDAGRGAGAPANAAPPDGSASSTMVEDTDDTTVLDDAPVADADADDTIGLDPVDDDATAAAAVTATAATSPGGTGAGGPSPTTDEPAWRRWAPFWVPVAVAALLAVAWVGWTMWDRGGEALPGVSVEGVDVGGLDRDGITAALQPVVDSRREAVITATADGTEYTMSLGEEGYRADLDLAATDALAVGRTGPLGSVASHVRATLGQTWSIDLDGTTLAAPVEAFVAEVAADVDTPATEGEVVIDVETATVTSSDPADGIELVRDDATELVLAVAGTGQDASVDLPTRVLEPDTTAAMVATAVGQVETALAEPYVLARDDDAITIEPTEFAEWLDVAGPDDQFAVSLDEEALTAAMEGRGDRFEVEARSASYDVQGGYRTYDNKGSGTWDPTPAQVSIVEGRNGLAYDHEVAAQQVIDLYEAGDHTAELEIQVVEPRLSNDRAQELRPDALLGTFTTYEICCDNRTHNIRRMAELVDGAMLLPGENYSANDSVGPRTEEKGFLPAGAIIDGELDESDIGGGISQTATTFYNAAFFAGIEVLEHRPHSWPISRYPLAREATFSYDGDLDINILNNTEGALIVKTSTGADSVTFSIFGKDDGRTVTADMGQPTDYTDYETERRPNPELPAGAQQVVQSGGQGFTVDYRRIIEGGTTPGTENYSWTYPPKTEIIEYGPGGGG